MDVNNRTNMRIPGWTAEGVLPPIDPMDPTSPARSPYESVLTDVILRFGTSKNRLQILQGFLGYRQRLHKLGLTRGFQWLDGSFMENVELIENRMPRDMDVVTFFEIPAGATQQQIFDQDPDVFDNDSVKSAHMVDAYLVTLDSTPNLLVDQAAYWYGVWSHRRTMIWKGFVRVDLDPVSDAKAGELLAAIEKEGEFA